MDKKYENALMSGIKAFSEHSFWFKNDNVKVGYSYASIDIDDECGYFTVFSEDENVVESGDYDGWWDFFENNEDVQFVITRDCAEDNEFVTWDQFKAAIDGGDKIHICTL